MGEGKQNKCGSIIVPKKQPECDPLRGNNADEYTYWAENKWKDEYEASHVKACQNMDTQEAWRICEAFDEECPKRRIILQGIDDKTSGEGRGKIPRREPWKAESKVCGKEWATKRWVQCNEWLKKAIRMG